MFIFGTRPEAIKLAPLITELKNRGKFDIKIVVTGQHRQMLDQVLEIFSIKADVDLNIMREKQSLFEITKDILGKLEPVFEEFEPDLVLVHGDTSSSFVGALAAYYRQIPLGHVEAGLRTNNIYAPFPEEINRQFISLVAKYNFAPTETARKNLIKENKDKDSIFVTGNTVIDAMKTTVNKDFNHSLIDWLGEDKLILLTAHRRENLGRPMQEIFRAIKRIILENEGFKLIYPIHLNPVIKYYAKEVFGDLDRVRLVDPFDVVEFHNFMARAHLILTDSGGVQEEAPSLGVPVLVLRNTTERPEGIEAGSLKLVGNKEESVYTAIKELLEDQDLYNKMANAGNPYGDGRASQRIADILEEKLYNEGK